jgi:FlaA1/EpsC-like NDP-sugar epimerase
MPVVAGQAGKDRTGSMQIVFTGVRPGEKLDEELSFDAESMQPTRHADINIWHLAPPEDGLIKDMLCTLSPEIRETDARLLAAAVRRLAGGMPCAAVA